VVCLVFSNPLVLEDDEDTDWSSPSSTPLIHTPTPSSSSIVVVPTSKPVIPSGAGPKTTSTPAASTPVTPLATGAASRAAVGAGAGLAGVFALAAYLL
jgi:hypothetical protein